MEGVFRFKSWFLNAPGLIHGGVYYRNFTVCHYWPNNWKTHFFLSIVVYLRALINIFTSSFISFSTVFSGDFYKFKKKNSYKTFTILPFHFYSQLKTNLFI